ncbi:hypothetical protein [Photobacterium galatheae]|uniref:Uncharacterized protein n=1 Tax=Photobacterium galatheae TaxID=1654360 RepID=A0A066RP27_9GAMM|nr:hypothetical protein [Photobacterium galatheae]KDM90876.1 hypothetical protein EA58_14040 [Photobacterium galatheae]MCM0149156.1 hypothetical protein [Photobacterium galatheae]
MTRFQLLSSKEAYSRRLIDYPSQIKDGFSECLTQCLATYDISDRQKIGALSLLCDIVATSIESNLLCAIFNLEATIEEDYGFERHCGESLRYLHYPEYITKSILHAIRVFKYAYHNEFEHADGNWIDDLIIEELADNIAYHIEILTLRHTKEA